MVAWLWYLLPILDFIGLLALFVWGFFDFSTVFARKFNVAGPLGVQLDSLADMVTSGVVPGYVMYKMLADAEVNSRFNANLNTVESLQNEIYFCLSWDS